MRGYVKTLVGKFKDFESQGREAQKLIRGILEPRLINDVRYNSIYNGEDFSSELLYAALSKLSIESASESLILKNARAPSGRQGRRHWERPDYREWWEIKKECLDETFKIFKKRGMLRKKPCAAVDYHDRPYHGDENDDMVRGIKPKDGTSWGHTYLSLDIIASGRAVTLDLLPRGKFAQTPKLLRKLLQEGSKRTKMDIILLDREFFSVDCIKVLLGLGLRFIIPAKDTDEVKRLKRESRWEVPCKLNYTMRSSSGEEVNVKLCLAKKKRGKGVQGFITNMNWGPKAVAEFYRSRWEIETNHRTRNEFRPVTSSKHYPIRFLYFLLSTILRNIWSIVTHEPHERDQNPLKICHMKEFVREELEWRCRTWAGRPSGPGPPDSDNLG